MSDVDVTHFSVDQKPISRFRRSWLSAFLAIAGFAVVIGIIYFLFYVPRPLYAEINLAGSHEQVPLDQFYWEKVSNVRSIATISTCFTRETWLTTDLFALQNGEVIHVARKVAGRSSKSSRPSDPYLMNFPVTFALADAETDDGFTTLLDMRGASRSFGTSGGIYDPFEMKTSETFTGRIAPGDQRLLYVEGDSEFNARPEMTIREFLAKNRKGNYLIVIIRFER